MCEERDVWGEGKRGRRKRGRGGWNKNLAVYHI